MCETRRACVFVTCVYYRSMPEYNCVGHFLHVCPRHVDLAVNIRLRCDLCLHLHNNIIIRLTFSKTSRHPSNIFLFSFTVTSSLFLFIIIYSVTHTIFICQHTTYIDTRYDQLKICFYIFVNNPHDVNLRCTQQAAFFFCFSAQTLFFYLLFGVKIVIRLLRIYTHT